MANEVTRLEDENSEKARRIKRQAFSIALLEHDLSEAERRELIALKISRRYKRRKMML